MRHRRGMFGKRLDAPKALGAGKDAKRTKEGTGCFEPPFELKADHPARGFHLTLRQAVAFMRREPGVAHAGYGRARGQPYGQRTRAAHVTIHANGQSLDASEDQITVEWAGYGAHGFLNEVQALCER